MPHLRRQKALLTVPQQALYRTLTRALGPETLIILPRVNLGHLVQHPNDESYRKHWQSICRQWIDFVLCNPSSFAPVLAIKIETPSDRRQRLSNRRAHPNARDTLEHVLTSVKIPLLRVLTKVDYDIANLITEIRRALLGVMEIEKQKGLTRRGDAEKLYFEYLDGETDQSPSRGPTPGASSGSDR